MFDFAFEAAADQLATLIADGNGADTLETSLYRERARRKVEQLRSVGLLLDALVKGFNEKTHDTDLIAVPEGLLRGKADRIGINYKKKPVATRKRLELFREITKPVRASAEDHVDWADFTAEELFRFAFMSGKRWAMSPEQHAAMARFLAETGVEVGLADAVAAAGEALPDWERKSLTADLAAIRAWRAVLDGRAKRPPANWSLAVLAFLEAHFASDYIVLVYGHSRPWSKMVAEETVEAWIELQLAKIE